MSGKSSVRITDSSYDFMEILSLVLAYIVLLYPLVTRSCGADTEEYYRIYIRDYTDVTDFTFNIICKALHSVIPSPRVGLGIISAVTLLIVFHAFASIKDYIEIQYAFFAYITTLYLYLYNYMRIMIAVSLIIWGYSLIVRNKRTLAFIPLCLAILFHRSAGVVLIVYIGILCFRNYKKLVTVIGGFAVAVFISRPLAFLRLISLDHYSSQIDISAVESASIGLGTIIRILPFFLLLYLYRFMKDEFVYSASLYFCLANLAFSFLGYFVSTASRISNMYFVFHLLFFVPWILKNDNNMTRARLVAVFSIAYCMFSYYLLTGNFVAMKIIPYS